MGKVPTATGDASDRRGADEKGSPDLKKMRNDSHSGDKDGTGIRYGKHISSQARGDNVDRDPSTITKHKSTITGK